MASETYRHLDNRIAGDLHPYIALAKGLIDRGYQPRIVTSEVYREKLDREGIDFIAAPPDLSDVKDESEMMRKAMDRFGGPVMSFKTWFLPHLQTQSTKFSTMRRAMRIY